MDRLSVNQWTVRSWGVRELADGCARHGIGAVHPRAGPERRRRANRIAGFQVSDFLTPLPADVLLGRAMMGDGVVDFGPMCRAVSAAGYAGDVEVEIFNADVWAADPAGVLALLKDRYETLIAHHLDQSSEMFR